MPQTRAVIIVRTAQRHRQEGLDPPLQPLMLTPSKYGLVRGSARTFFFTLKFKLRAPQNR